LARSVAEDGAVRHFFQCSALHSDNPFWPFVQQLLPAAAIVERLSNLADGRDRGQTRREIVDRVANLLFADYCNWPALLYSRMHNGPIARQSSWCGASQRPTRRHC
jgi:hypothetical protein